MRADQKLLATRFRRWPLLETTGPGFRVNRSCMAHLPRANTGMSIRDRRSGWGENTRTRSCGRSPANITAELQLIGLWNAHIVDPAIIAEEVLVGQRDAVDRRGQARGCEGRGETEAGRLASGLSVLG